MDAQQVTISTSDMTLALFSSSNLFLAFFFLLNSGTFLYLSLSLSLPFGEIPPLLPSLDRGITLSDLKPIHSTTHFCASLVVPRRPLAFHCSSPLWVRVRHGSSI